MAGLLSRVEAGAVRQFFHKCPPSRYRTACPAGPSRGVWSGEAASLRLPLPVRPSSAMAGQWRFV